MFKKNIDSNNIRQIVAGFIIILLMLELLMLMYNMSQYELVFIRLTNISHQIFRLENKKCIINIQDELGTPASKDEY